MDGAGGSSAGNGAATALTSSMIGRTSVASSGNGSSRSSVLPLNRLRFNRKSSITHLVGSRPFKTFLRSSPIYLHEAANTTRGRTWIELLIIYRMLGYEIQTRGGDRQALTRWSLGQSLHHFRLQVRRTIKALCPPTQHRCITGQADGQPLIHLGITTHLTTLPITIPLTQEAETEVATRIIQSQASSSFKAAARKLQQKQWVIQHRLRTKGRTKWLDSIPQWKGDPFSMNSHTEEDTHQPTTDNTTMTNTTDNTTITNTTTSLTSNEPDDTNTSPTAQVRLPDIILLHCPTCKHAVDGTRDKFQLDKLNHRTWCRACQRSRFVKLWQCRCGIPWHTCITHQAEPNRLRRVKTPADTNTEQTSRPTTTQPSNHLVGSSEVQQWLRQPTRKTSGTMDIVFTQKDQDIAKDMVTKRRKHSTTNKANTLPQTGTTQVPNGGEGSSASSSGNGSVSAMALSCHTTSDATPGAPQHKPASELL